MVDSAGVFHNEKGTNIMRSLACVPSVCRHAMHVRHSVSVKPKSVTFLAGVLGGWVGDTQTNKKNKNEDGVGRIAESYSDLNMAILPSGVTEDKVHRQLCNRSTCQWNVFHPSYCKTQCIVVIMLVNPHSWS